MQLNFHICLMLLLWWFWGYVIYLSNIHHEIHHQNLPQTMNRTQHSVYTVQWILVGEDWVWWTFKCYCNATLDSSLIQAFNIQKSTNESSCRSRILSSKKKLPLNINFVDLIFVLCKNINVHSKQNDKSTKSFDSWR